MKIPPTCSLRFLPAILSLLLWLPPAPASAQNTNVVLMGSFLFNPAVLNIAAGDYVRWTNTTVTQHNSHQNTNLWDGPLLGLGGNYVIRLPTAGFYPYYCTPHLTFNQTGSVTVVNPVTNVVLMGSFFFNPAVLNIAAGDYVRWTNTTVTQHNSHQNTNLWDGPLLGLGGNYNLRLMTPGAYPYYCTPHLLFNQTGSVLVASANQPPLVSLTSPANGQSFGAPASLTLTANASDSDGSITNVQFLANQAVLGNDDSAPYSLNWTNIPAGTYSLVARATDNRGATTTSATVSITLTNLPPQAVTLLGPSWTGTEFSFSFATLAGRPYQIQRRESPAAGNWQVVTNLTGTGGTVTVTDRPQGSTGSFYRVASQ